MSKSRHSHLTQKDYQAQLLQAQTKLTSQDVAALPKPGTTAPTSIKFLDQHRLVYLLAPDATDLTRQLFVHDLTSTGDGSTSSSRHPVVVGGTHVEEGTFSLEEQMRRERARLHATGVTSYQLSLGVGNDDDDKEEKEEKEDACKILIPHGGGLWILDNLTTSGSDLTKLTPRLLLDKTAEGLPQDATILDAKLSADASTVAFVADKEVYVLSTETTTTSNDPPKQVTFGARGVEGRTNGTADYLAMEELERPEGFWLSPNGKFLAFEQVDESHIPAYRIVHQAAPQGLAPSLKAGMPQEEMVQATTVTHEEHRFCFAGTVNPKVKFGIQKISTANETGETILWLELESIFGPDFYLAKFEWLKDNSAIIVQVLDRKQQKLALVYYFVTTGRRVFLHLEQTKDDTSWVNLNDGGFRVLDYQPENMKLKFLWASEQDGYRHLYVIDASLKPQRPEYTIFDVPSKETMSRVTPPGEYIVDNVVHVDLKHELVYYMGTSPGTWLEKRLYRTSYQPPNTGPPQPVECLTPEPGQHVCVLNAKAGLFVDVVSTLEYPTKVMLRKLPSPDTPTTVAEELGGGHIVTTIYNAGETDPRVAAWNLKPPTFHTFSSTDQKVTLQAALYLPDATIHGPGPYPLLVATYGGPHVQYVQNTWGMMTADLRSQFLRDHGLAVLKVDNRGSNRRGLVFETPIYGNMGQLEVEDQVAGVQWAVQEGYANVHKVSVSGWSYGGYMALKCLAERPDVFHAAVVGAPVTDWTLYDTAYTERYMGLPQDNVEGYQRSSALHKIKDIEGSLMLCHGLLDENVLFRQTAVLINELMEHQKAFELQLFPSERHGPRRNQDRAFLEERILAFLQRSLCLDPAMDPTTSNEGASAEC